MLVVGYFNNDLATPEDQARDEDIVAAMDTTGIKDTSGHFLPWHGPWFEYGRTWCIQCRGQ